MNYHQHVSQLKSITPISATSGTSGFWSLLPKKGKIKKTTQSFSLAIKTVLL